MTDTDDLGALEARRCAAIAAGDVEALKALLTDDYVHVHMTGKVDDRGGHLAAIAGRPRRIERGKLLVRVYGDLAVLTGEQVNHMAGPGGEVTLARAFCHQVAVRDDRQWRFASVQLTPLQEAAK